MKDGLRPCKALQELLPPLGGDDYERLKEALALSGIHVPIVVGEDGILDGAHRYAIAQELGIKDIPIIRSKARGKDAIKQGISLNLARRHLTPEQKRELIGKLRAQRWTQEEVAQVVGMTQTTVSKSEGASIMNFHNACVPDLRVKLEPRHRAEVVKRVKAGETQAKVAADYGITHQRVSQLLARAQEPPQDGSKPQLYSPGTLAHNVIIGDARDILPLLPPGSVDLVVTSPPYFSLKEYQHDLGVNLQDFHLYLGDLGAVFAGCHRALREGAFLCVVVGQYTSNNGSYYIPGHIAALLEGAGFRFAREHIWVKPLGVQGIWNHGTTSFLHEPWPRNTMINVHHEHILIYQKGVRAQVFPGRDALSEEEVKEYCWSVWQLPPSPLKEHPAPFPLEIPERLIKMYSYEREVVLDPFLGTGTSIQAAKALKRRGLGIEVEPKYLPLIQRVTGGVNVIRHDQGQLPDFDSLLAGGGSLEVPHL